MRLRCILLLAAAFVLVPAVHAASNSTAPSTDAPAQVSAEASTADAACQPNQTAAASFDVETVETLFSGRQGAENRAECWIQTKTTWTCDCFVMGQVRARRHNWERTCCGNGLCDGWHRTSSYCTGNICG